MANVSNAENTNMSANDGSWLLLAYRPASMFSLRSTFATNKGGKTLLVPTPYAVKLALVDACFRVFDANNAEKMARHVFSLIKSNSIRFLPPKHCIVQNTFMKVKQEDREAPKGIFTSTIAYREFCFFKGDIRIAISVSGLDNAKINILADVARHINYFGKRGGFFQFIGDELLNELPVGFSLYDTDSEFELGSYGVMQALDDIGESDTVDLFDRINSYSSDKVVLGKHRKLKNTFLSYRVVGSSRHYTYYARD